MRKRIYTRKNVQGERIVVSHLVLAETVLSNEKNNELESFERGLRNKIQKFKKERKNENHL